MIDPLTGELLEDATEPVLPTRYDVAVEDDEPLTPDQQRFFEEKLARVSFPAYVHLMHLELTGRDFQEVEFHTAILAFLMDCYDGKVLHGDINIPPRYGKTYLMCLWISWAFGQYPDCWFLYITMVAELAEQSATDVKKFMQTRLYKRLFPKTVIDRNINAREKFHTTAGGRMLSRGIGGVVTGYGGGVLGVHDRFSGAIVVDDLLKMQDVRSAVLKSEGIEFVRGTLSSRQNTERAPYIFIGQRGAPDDIFSFLHPKDPEQVPMYGVKWTNLTMPALDQNDQSVWPEHKSTAWCHALRLSSPWEWETQYMQKPYNLAGAIFNTEMMPILTVRPKGPFKVCRGWDLAARELKKGRTKPDFTATILLVYYFESKMYVIEHAFQFRKGPEVVREVILNTAHRDGYDVKIRIPRDPAQAGVSQSQEMAAMLNGYLINVDPMNGDKVTNADPAAAQMNVGLIACMEPYADLVKSQLQPFPDGAHDDLVDALSAAYATLAIPNEDDASRQKAAAAILAAAKFEYGPGLSRVEKDAEMSPYGPTYLPGEEPV